VRSLPDPTPTLRPPDNARSHAPANSHLTQRGFALAQIRGPASAGALSCSVQRLFSTRRCDTPRSVQRVGQLLALTGSTPKFTVREPAVGGVRRPYLPGAWRPPAVGDADSRARGTGRATARSVLRVRLQRGVVALRSVQRAFSARREPVSAERTGTLRVCRGHECTRPTFVRDRPQPGVGRVHGSPVVEHP
jgi:hypothetical protein